MTSYDKVYDVFLGKILEDEWGEWTEEEVKRDLFTASDNYALAHCISADFALGAGIAKEFDRRFNCRKRLFKIFEGSWIPRWDRTQERYKGGCVTLGIGMPIADEPPFTNIDHH